MTVEKEEVNSSVDWRGLSDDTKMKTNHSIVLQYTCTLYTIHIMYLQCIHVHLYVPTFSHCYSESHVYL